MCCPFMNTIRIQCFSDSGHMNKELSGGLLVLSLASRIVSCVFSDHIYNIFRDQ